VENEAENAGLTRSSYVREKLLAAPKTRSRRRVRADVAALAKLIAELNRIGGNINSRLPARQITAARGKANGCKRH